MAKDDKTLLDDEDELELEESSEESEEGGKKLEAEPEGEESEEVAAEEGEEGSGETKEPTEEDSKREEIRARRKREKKRRAEQERREKWQSQQTILALQKTVKEQSDLIKNVTGNIADNESKQIDNEIAELGRIYNEAQSKMSASITAQDGESFRKAKEIADRAWARYNTLELTKKQRTGTAKAATVERKESESYESATVQDTQPKIQLGSDAQRYGMAFAKKNANWYKTDQRGQPANLDSMIVQQLDKELYDEGYDPETKEYWDELESRSIERMPHIAKHIPKGSTTAKPKVITGGGGRDGGGAGQNHEKTLPGQFIQALKQAGHWDDPKKKKAAIDDYLRNKKAKG